MAFALQDRMKQFEIEWIPVLACAPMSNGKKIEWLQLSKVPSDGMKHIQKLYTAEYEKQIVRNLSYWSHSWPYTASHSNWN